MVNVILSSGPRNQLGVVLWSQTSRAGGAPRRRGGFPWASSQAPTQLLTHQVGCGRELQRRKVRKLVAQDKSCSLGEGRRGQGGAMQRQPLTTSHELDWCPASEQQPPWKIPPSSSAPVFCCWTWRDVVGNIPSLWSVGVSCPSRVPSHPTCQGEWERGRSWEKRKPWCCTSSVQQ